MRIYPFSTKSSVIFGAPIFIPNCSTFSEYLVSLHCITGVDESITDHFQGGGFISCQVGNPAIQLFVLSHEEAVFFAVDWMVKI